MVNVALCVCGIDVTDHEDISDHAFDASGTKYPCLSPVDGYLCPRPGHHDDYNVPCGPLTGDKLW